MRMQIKYHSQYEAEAKELESYLENPAWDENHEVISEGDDGVRSLDVEMIESEDDEYSVACEGQIVISNPDNHDEVVSAILESKEEWGVKPYEYDDDGNPIDKPE